MRFSVVTIFPDMFQSSSTIFENFPMGTRSVVPTGTTTVGVPSNFLNEAISQWS